MRTPRILRKILNPSISSRIAWLAAVLAASSCAWAHAQDAYPTKPVRIVVPFPGGGALDIPTRIVAEKLREHFGKSFIVDNRPGASGNIGTEQVVRAAGDGYTLLMGASANTSINRFLYKKLPFDVDRDLVPIAQFASSANVIYVNPSFPATNLKDMIAQLRLRPGAYSYASPGNGTTPHLAMEMLKATQKVFIVHIPFRGSPPAVTAVASNEPPVGIDSVIATLQLVRSGKLRALAVTSEARVSSLPDVPTTAEAGVEGLAISNYLGLFAPSGTPRAVTSALSAEVERIVQSKDTADRIAGAGAEPHYLGPAAFAQRMHRDREAFRDAVRFSGAKVD